MTVFIGLDLAWTAHHETGVCVLKGDAGGVELLGLECLMTTPSAFADLCRAHGDNVIVAIDAPLIVEPERCAERELGHVFGKYNAGAYTATWKFLDDMDGLAGPNLAIALRQRGFTVVPSGLRRRATGRVAVEVFPHPAHVVLFGLEERLKYKKGHVAERRKVLCAYQSHLRTLLGSELPTVLGSPLVQAVLEPAATTAAGHALKNLEDRLDALTCAYVAYHCWNHGPNGYRVFGSDAHGAIVTPLLVPATSGLARSSP